MPPCCCSGTNVGVAKGVNLVSVRVLDSRGSGTWSGVIAGIDYVANNIAKPNRIISMSLGGGANVGVNDAVARATAAGVLAVVAAGNSGADACNYSPGEAVPLQATRCCAQQTLQGC